MDEEIFDEGEDHFHTSDENELETEGKYPKLKFKLKVTF